MEDTAVSFDFDEDTAVSFVLEKLKDVQKSPSIRLAGAGRLRSIEKKLVCFHEFLQNSAGGVDQSPELLKLVSRIRHVAFDAEDTIDRVAAQAAKQRLRSKIRTFLFRCNHVPAIADIRKRATSVCQRIDQVYLNQDRYSIQKIRSRRDEDALRSFRKDAGKSEMGFAEDEKMLEKKLLEASVSGLQVISLVGMGGLGKTSLARRIFHRKQVEQHFKCRAWVSVSKENSTMDLLKTMVKQFRVSITSEEEEDLKAAISARLQQQGNRYLVVLDDVWDPKFWDQIKEAFPGNGSGSRILITTRDKRVASNASPNPPHQLKPMSNHDSWELFMEKINSANMDKEIKETLKSNKVKILMKCDGLPLAIVSLAKEIVCCHDQSLTKYLDDDEVSWLPRTELDSLVMSYNELSLHLRRCFLYFGLFPRNFDIPVRRLYRLWLAEGFVELSSETKSPEDLVEEYLQDLVDRNLIQMSKFRSDDSPKTCRMPGVLRDIFVSKAQEIGMFYIHRNSESAGAPPQLPVRRVVEHTNIKEFLHSDVDVQHVRSYISFNTMKNDQPAVDIGSFVSKVIRVQRYGILRVLDLEHVYKPKLPEELGEFYYLRYLGLRWTFLDSLPSSVGDLSYLETLDIKHTYITTLPNSIWKIKKLRHLLLNEIRLDMSLNSMVTSPPTRVQTLWGLFVDKKSPVKNGLDRLLDLRKLGLTCHPDSIQEVIQWIAKISSLEALRIRCKDKLHQPPLLSLDCFSGLGNLTHLYLLGKLKKLPASGDFPPKLKVLTLSISELKEDPMPVLSQLPELKVLKLYARSYLGDTMDCPKGGFSKLYRLRLWMLDGLKTWTLHEGAMQSLQKVEIRCCDNLKELPDRLLRISALESITFTNMEQLAENLEARKQEDKSITVKIKNRRFAFHDRPKQILETVVEVDAAALESGVGESLVA